MEPDRVHANKCTLAVMCLREYFPLDIIGLIATTCWDLRSMPVYALLTDKTYMFYDWEIIKQNIFTNWPQLKPRRMKFRVIYEHITYGVFTCSNVGLLIPGYVWDAMMINYQCIDNDVISCDSIELKETRRDILPITSHAVICYDSLDPMLDSTPNGVQILSPVYLIGTIDDRVSYLINLFINTQNKVAF
jgi:hypothetical protein